MAQNKKLILSFFILLFLLPSVLSANLTIQYDDHPVYQNPHDKIHWIVELPQAYKQYDFTCISYVVKNNEYIQINPKKTQQNNNFINLLFSVLDEGEHFQTNNGIGHVYFTTEKLKIDGLMDFTYGVSCGYGSTILTEERNIVPSYTDLDVVTNRGLWAIDNMGYIIGGFITLILIIVLIKLLFFNGD